jgi:hypothetical protein
MYFRQLMWEQNWAHSCKVAPHDQLPSKPSHNCCSCCLSLPLQIELWYVLWLTIPPAAKFAPLSMFILLKTWMLWKSIMNYGWFGQNVVSEGTVRQWCRMFKHGQTNVHDEEQSGRQAICSDWWSCSNCWPKKFVKDGTSQFQNFVWISTNFMLCSLRDYHC